MEQTGRAEGAARHPGRASFYTSMPAPAAIASHGKVRRAYAVPKKSIDHLAICLRNKSGGAFAAIL